MLPKPGYRKRRSSNRISRVRLALVGTSQGTGETTLHDYEVHDGTRHASLCSLPGTEDDIQVKPEPRGRAAEVGTQLVVR
jgi:hypothetical protein